MGLGAKYVEAEHVSLTNKAHTAYVERAARRGEQDRGISPDAVDRESFEVDVVVVDQYDTFPGLPPDNG